MAYHSWNHRYKASQQKVQKIVSGGAYFSEIQKAVRRLKRSSEVLFGVISSNVFVNELMKFEGERANTEQTES